MLLQGGQLRLWTADSDEYRDSRPVDQGGNYVAPGVEYPLSKLDGGLYVEAVELSAGVADLPIRVEVDPTGTLGYVWQDELRVTASSLESPYVDSKAFLGCL